MGTIVFSLDTETIWGRINDPHCVEFMPQYQDTSTVLFRLISLFDKYDIPATWAFVGLAIAPEQMLKIFIRESYRDVYGEYEQSNFLKNINYLGEKRNEYSLIQHLHSLVESNVSHDIGSHTFSHLYAGWQKASEREQKFKSDLELFRQVTEIYDFKPCSFIYPRNRIFKKELLNDYGYKIFRAENNDFSNKWMRRLNEVLPLKAFPVKPEQLGSTQVSLSGSMLYRVKSLGFRKNIPVSWIHKKACMGVENLVGNDNVFHIWLHPFNFSYKAKAHFMYFEKLLKKIDKYREKGLINIKTMKEFVI